MYHLDRRYQRMYDGQIGAAAWWKWSEMGYELGYFGVGRELYRPTKLCIWITSLATFNFKPSSPFQPEIHFNRETRPGCLEMIHD